MNKNNREVLRAMDEDKEREKEREREREREGGREGGREGEGGRKVMKGSGRKEKGEIKLLRLRADLWFKYFKF